MKMRLKHKCLYTSFLFSNDHLILVYGNYHLKLRQFVCMCMSRKIWYTYFIRDMFLRNKIVMRRSCKEDRDAAAIVRLSGLPTIYP